MTRESMRDTIVNVLKRTRKRPLVSLLLLIAAVGLGTALYILAGWLVYRDAQLVPVLLYHDISAGEDKPKDTCVRVFENEMRFLHENGYHVIPLRQLIDHMESGASLPDKPVVITFDDGEKSNYTLAYPVLKRFSMPATIFLAGGAVGEPHMLVWDDMREMENSGLVDIQAHTYGLHWEVFTEPTLDIAKPAMVTPAYFPKQNRYETEEEFENKVRLDLIRSRKVIAENLHHEADTLAWPYGAYNRRSLRLASEAGFKYFATLHSGMNRRGESTLTLRRIDCEGNIPLSRFKDLVEPDRSFKGYLNRLKSDCRRRASEIHRWGW
ncbi:MAG: polysaccharide deacetylase family protein [Firmicutes bacterium]|nr:polysaccharide deacetylase family protein [Bacillota bacterium]